MMKKKNKPIPEAKDAKEVAKKLIRSGAIAAIQVGSPVFLMRKNDRYPYSARRLSPQKSVEKEAKAKAEKSTGFKRSQGLERKLTGLSDGARAGYQGTISIEQNVVLSFHFNLHVQIIHYYSGTYLRISS